MESSPFKTIVYTLVISISLWASATVAVVRYLGYWGTNV